MGFDQYHEPRPEPPVEPRTFARLCAAAGGDGSLGIGSLKGQGR